MTATARQDSAAKLARELELSRLRREPPLENVANALQLTMAIDRDTLDEATFRTVERVQMRLEALHAQLSPRLHG